MASRERVGEYLLDNRAAEAEQRFAALSALYDPVTFNHIARLGLRVALLGGRRGRAVGAALAGQAGRTRRRGAGHRHRHPLDRRPGSGRAGPAARRGRRRPPPGGFDLVHARLVLVHIPARDEVLRRLAAALWPGGWLLVEDYDVRLQPLADVDPRQPAHHLANELREGLRALLVQRGVDLAYGRKLPRLLAEQGLVEVAADGYAAVAHPAMGAMDAANLAQVGDALIAQGRTSREELQEHLDTIDRGLGLASPLLVSAWGRRP